MPERESREQFEKKYELPEENIIECDENSPLFKQLPKSLKELPWPVEIQGAAITKKEKKEFKIWYPRGDIFLSMATIIHELGHLRQSEINPELDMEKDFKSTSEYYETNCAREKDANSRGWERAEKYCPDIIKEIEDVFQKQKTQGRLMEFSNFKALFDFFTKISLFINNFYKEFDIQKGGEVREKIKKKYPKIEEKNLKRRATMESQNSLADAIKANEKIYNFFRNTDDFRAGEKIDSDFARKFIKQAAEKIAEEKY